MKYEFLIDVPRKELLKILKHNIKNKTLLNEISRDVIKIHNVLFSIYSYDILLDTNIRRLVVYYASEKSIEQFKEFFKLNDNIKKYDLATIVSLKPWRYGSEAYHLLKKEFNISSDFLPKRQQALRKIEIINGKENLNDLFDYQKEILEKLFNFFCSDQSSVIVQMPTGSGKTRTMLESIIVYFLKTENQKVIWLAHSEELLEQAIESLKKIWSCIGVDEISIGRFWGNYNTINNIDEIDFIFISHMKLISLHKNNKDEYENLFSEFKILVVDEAHKSSSTVLGRLIDDFKNNKNTKLIGLTATPGRSFSDFNENLKFIDLYNKNIITPNTLGNNPIKTLQNRGILSKIVTIDFKHGENIHLTGNEIDNFEYTNDVPTSILKKLAKNKRRNNLLKKVILKEVESDKQVLVFCCTVEHSKTISMLLAMDGVLSVSVDYNMKMSTRRKVVNEFRRSEVKVLLNYGIFSTGLDIPKIDTIIISRPTTSIVLYSQMIGRGIRGPLMGGTENCRLIDIRDNFENYGNVDDVYNYFKQEWKIN